MENVADSRDHMSNNEVLEKMETKKKIMFNLRKRQLKILGYIMKKAGLEKLIHTGKIEGRSDRKMIHNILSEIN